MLEVIRQRLRPGGLAYLSYNVTTGWGSMVPLRALMRMLAEANPSRTDQAAVEVMDMIDRLKAAGALFFPANPGPGAAVAGHAPAGSALPRPRVPQPGLASADVRRRRGGDGRVQVQLHRQRDADREHRRRLGAARHGADAGGRPRPGAA